MDCLVGSLLLVGLGGSVVLRLASLVAEGVTSGGDAVKWMVSGVLMTS